MRLKFNGFIKFTILTIFLLFPYSAESKAARCPGLQARASDPDGYSGVRTKWRSLQRDARNSITPYLAGLTVEAWAKSLEAAGANLAELNIDPSRTLSDSPSVDKPTWSKYIDYVVNDGRPENRFLDIESKVIPEFRYSVEQRNDILIAFLKKLEELREANKIKGSFTFVVHQRLWFDGTGSRGDRRRARSAEEFASDMSGLINRARDECLDHWIEGVRLGEHAVTDMNIIMPLSVDLAHRINAQTDGWLKHRFFLMNGGGWGAEYTAFGLNFNDFFQNIAAETGSFALGYKFMQFKGKNGGGYIRERMAASQCGLKECDVKSYEDWIFYLEKLGLKQLKGVIDIYKLKFPYHANVMFVGDSSDSVQTIFNNDFSPEIAALQHVLPHGPGWAGKLFMSGFVDDETINSRISRNSGSDVGWALYSVSDGKPVLQSRTFEIWKNW